MTSALLRKPGHDAGGIVHRLTPKDAGWGYVGFEVLDLAPGAAVERSTGDRETCLVLIGGKGEAQANGQSFGAIGERPDPFAAGPHALYVPAGGSWRFTATTPVELAVCTSPGKGGLPPRLITPAEAGEEIRGKGTNTRHVRNILPDSAPGESLLVVEVITPGGHWSSYPPHKHDTSDPPRETYLEETYYHRLRPAGGFAFQRVYTDDGGLDETMAIGDRDLVLVPRGYHPVGSPHGFDLYYLNVMAGPVRQWRFTMAASHAFLGW
jgi:5-deoxy-glucuronate isomerase